MILSCQNISKAFVENQVLKNVSFHIEDHEKAAIVGINGAGKTTLLRIIVGEMTPDDGQVVLARDKTLGYLAQNSTVDTSHTIYEELLSVKADLLRLEEKIRECENNMKHAEGDALEDLMKQYTSLTHAFETGGGYLYRSELVGVLKGLGFTEDEFSKPVATLSGGQKTRVALGRLLLQNPDLIILDEPTNHLDMNSIAWLETYLLNYKGAVLIVSHDRYFLDRIAGKVIEILPWLRGDEFDAVMNYPLGESIKDFWIDKSQTNQDFEYTINRCYTNYMQQTNDVLFNLLDSHDTKRLRSDTKNLDQYFAQLAVLFAMPGSPCIYYGTEIAMPGSYDPDCRRCMPWDDIEAGRFKERIEMVSKLIHLRASEPLLKGRNFHFPDDFADNPRVIQFRKMGWVDTYVEVIVNCSDEDIEVPKDGEVLFERHCIDNTLLTNGILIRKIVGNDDK